MSRVAALLLAAIVPWAGFAVPAVAGPDTPEDLRNELLRGRTPGEWDGTLKAIVAKPGKEVGDTLGPIFTNAEHAKRLDLLARVAAYLAQHPVPSPKGEQIQLAELILQRALLDDGEVYLNSLRDQLVVDRTTGRRPDWDRLLEAARAKLAQPASAIQDRLAAMVFLGRERWERANDVLLSLTLEAKRQAAATAAGPEKEALETGLLDALERILEYRFASSVDVARQLEETKDLSLPDRLRHFSRLKNGAAGDPVAIRWLKEAVKKIDSPAQLAEALRDMAGYHEVRKAVLQRAAELKPRPVTEWTPFFQELFKSVRDQKLLLDGLDLLASAGFGGGPGECCRPVAQAIQERLASRNPPDVPDLRVRMVMTLGDLGAYEPVAQQISVVQQRGAVTEANVAEIAELVKAAGRCPGAKVDLLRGFYTLEGTTPDVRDALRTAVAAALGREGIRGADPAAAVAALTSILDGGPGWERVTSAKTRKAALASLGAYPGPETAEHLLRIATAEGPEAQDEATVAIATLAKMMSAGPGGHHGARALVAFLAETKGKAEFEARRVQALQRLKDLPAGDAVPAEVRGAVLAAVREALAEPGSEAQRAQAARTAVDLADPEAIPVLAAWWAEQTAQERSDLLQALLEAVVQKPAPSAAKPESDARVAEALRVVAKSPAHVSRAAEWAEALARSGARGGAPRPLLVSAHAEALLSRAASWPPDADGARLRRSDLTEAATNLRVAVRGARPEDAEGLRARLIEALMGLAETLGAGEEAKALYLEAVAWAVQSSTIPVLQQGVRAGRRLLDDETLRRLLKPEEKTNLESSLETLRIAIERPR